MVEQRDQNLGQSLLELPIPAESPDFWDRLSSELEAAAAPVTEVTLIEFDSGSADEGPSRRSMGILLLVAATLVVAGLGVARLLTESPTSTTTNPAGQDGSVDGIAPAPDDRTPEERAEFENQVMNLNYGDSGITSQPLILTDGTANIDVSTRGDIDTMVVELSHYMPSVSGPYAAVILTTTVDDEDRTSSIRFVSPEDPANYSPGDPLRSGLPVIVESDLEIRSWEVTAEAASISYLNRNGDSVTNTYRVEQIFPDHGPMLMPDLDETSEGSFSDDLANEFNTSLLNLTYPSEWSDTGEIALVDGEWLSTPADGEGATQTRVSIWSSTDGASAGTNLEGGMTSFSAVVLAIDPGGSGTFFDFYLVVPVGNGLYKSGDELMAIGPVPLGDRVEIDSLNASPRGMRIRLTDNEGVTRNREYDFDGEKFVRDNPPTWLGAPVSDTDLACWAVTNNGLLDQYAPAEPVDGRLIACDERDLDALLAEQPDASLLDLIDALVIVKVP